MYMYTLLTGIGSCFVISGLVLRHIGTSYSLDDIGLHSSDHRAGMFDDGSSGSIGQRRGSVLVCPSTRLLVLVPQVYVKI